MLLAVNTGGAFTKNSAENSEVFPLASVAVATMVSPTNNPVRVTLSVSLPPSASE